MTQTEMLSFHLPTFHRCKHQTTFTIYSHYMACLKPKAKCRFELLCSMDALPVGSTHSFRFKTHGIEPLFLFSERRVTITPAYFDAEYKICTCVSPSGTGF